MKGFVPTPEPLVDRMVEKLFAGLPPHEGSRLLDPGCGTGAFIQGLLRWAHRTGSPLPDIVGVDSDPALLEQAAARIGSDRRVSLLRSDFLTPRRQDVFDYVVGNPPYVSITGLSAAERDTYRRHFTTAVGRFDLYTLFFEQALRLLKPHGRLVFVTPEKFIYVESARRLRQQLAEAGVQEIEFIAESTFDKLVTYPVITTISRTRRTDWSQVSLRTGESLTVRLPRAGDSWLPLFSRARAPVGPHVLSEACARISCGVATGADQVFVLENTDIPAALRPFAHPTISGRQLTVDSLLNTSHSMLVPYADNGDLLAESDLGALGHYLRAEENHSRLLRRTCVVRKPWYSFHENPPLTDIRRPKILCKDIASRPRFVPDTKGDIVPRHSVYYLIPVDPEQLSELCDYLNSAETVEFLQANCQRAANGFLRLQSHVLKRVPLPAHFAPSPALAYA